VKKISELEEKLHEMDNEFERQTAKIKKQYDTTLRDEVARVTEKTKQDFKYTLDIRMQEQKSKLLREKLDFVNSLTGEKQVELVNLRLQQEQIKEANKKLSEALLHSEEELEKLHMLSAKKKWWPF
jgi:hypothetical protein